MRQLGQRWAGLAVSMATHPEAPSTEHRGHMPSEYLGLAVSDSGIGVGWESMRGLYPDNVYRFLQLSELGG